MIRPTQMATTALVWMAVSCCLFTCDAFVPPRLSVIASSFPPLHDAADSADRSQNLDADVWLEKAVQATMDEGGFDESSFLVGILGDLHIDPRKLDEYSEGRNHFLPIFERAKEAHGNVALVSLGDLGESKNCDHNEANPSELFAGTTLCHEMAAEFLRGFNVVSILFVAFGNCKENQNWFVNYSRILRLF